MYYGIVIGHCIKYMLDFEYHFHLVVKKHALHQWNDVSLVKTVKNNKYGFISKGDH
jgi:hypothetical protein